MQTLEKAIHDSAIGLNYVEVFMGIFGVLALALASVGVYGVMAYMVSEQTHEIGIRMALGAPRGGVMRMLFLRGMTTAASRSGGWDPLGVFAGPLCGRPDLRCHGKRPGDVCRNPTGAAGRGGAGDLRPSAARHAHRPDCGAAVRIRTATWRRHSCRPRPDSSGRSFADVRQTSR